MGFWGIVGQYTFNAMVVRSNRTRPTIEYQGLSISCKSFFYACHFFCSTPLTVLQISC
jgi:hypothetical protein